MAQTIFGGKPDPGAAVGAFSGAAQDIFAGFGDQAKAQGDLAEAAQYGLAAKYAGQELAYTKTSTAIQLFQQQRELTKSLGQTTADEAGAGLATSGSALDILRDSASQGALQHAVLAEQGLITEAGYKEQQQSYQIMQSAATQAAGAEKQAAGFADITAGLKVAVGLAMLPVGA